MHDTSMVYPVLVIDWDLENETIKDNSILLCSHNRKFNINGTPFQFQDRDLNIANINESIDIQDRKFKISDVTIKVSNFPQNLATRMSDRFYKNNVISKFIKIFWATDSIENLEDCLPIFVGIVRNVVFDDRVLTFKIEDYSQKDVNTKIPVARIENIENATVESDHLKPIPFTYGEVNYAPTIKFVDPEDPYKIFILADDDIRLTNTDRTKFINNNNDSEQLELGWHFLGTGNWSPFRPSEPALFIHKGQYCFIPTNYETVGDQNGSDGNLGAHTSMAQWTPYDNPINNNINELYFGSDVYTDIENDIGITGAIGHLDISIDSNDNFNNSVGWNEIQAWNIRYPYSFRILDKNTSFQVGFPPENNFHIFRWGEEEGYFLDSPQKAIDLEPPGYRNYQSPDKSSFARFPSSSSTDFEPQYPDTYTGELANEVPYWVKNFKIKNVRTEDSNVQNSSLFPKKIFGLNFLSKYLTGDNDNLLDTEPTMYLVMLPSWHQLRDRIRDYIDYNLAIPEYPIGDDFRPTSDLNVPEWNEELGYFVTRYTNLVSHTFGDQLNTAGFDNFNLLEWVTRTESDFLNNDLSGGGIVNFPILDFAQFNDSQLDLTNTVYRFKAKENKNITVAYTGNSSSNIYDSSSWLNFEENYFTNKHFQMANSEDNYYNSLYLPLQYFWKFDHFFKMKIKAGYIEESAANNGEGYEDYILTGEWNGIPLWEGVELEKDTGANLGNDFPVNAKGKHVFDAEHSGGLALLIEYNSTDQLPVFDYPVPSENMHKYTHVIPITHSFQGDFAKEFGRKSIEMGVVQKYNDNTDFLSDLETVKIVDYQVGNTVGAEYPDTQYGTNLFEIRSLAMFENSNLEDVLYCNTYSNWEVDLHFDMNDFNTPTFNPAELGYRIDYSYFWVENIGIQLDVESESTEYQNNIGSFPLYVGSFLNLNPEEFNTHIMKVGNYNNYQGNIYTNNMDYFTASLGGLTKDFRSGQNGARYGDMKFLMTEIRDDGLLYDLGAGDDNVFDMSFGSRIGYINTWDTPDHSNNILHFIAGNAQEHGGNLGFYYSAAADYKSIMLMHRIDFSNLNESNLYCYSKGRSDIITDDTTELVYVIEPDFNNADTLGNIDVYNNVIDNITNMFPDADIEDGSPNQVFMLIANDMFYGMQSYGLYDDSDGAPSYGEQWLTWIENHLGIPFVVKEYDGASFSALDGEPINKMFMKTSLAYATGMYGDDLNGLQIDTRTLWQGTGDASDQARYYDLFVFNEYGILQTPRGSIHSVETPLFHISNWNVNDNPFQTADHWDYQWIGLSYVDGENNALTDDSWNYNYSNIADIIANQSNADLVNLMPNVLDTNITFKDMSIKMEYTNSRGEIVNKHMPIINPFISFYGNKNITSIGAGDTQRLFKNRSVNTPSLIFKHIMMSELGISSGIINKNLKPYSKELLEKRIGDYNYKLAFSLNEEIEAKKFIEDIATNTQAFPRFTSEGKFDITYIFNDYDDSDVNLIIKEKDVRKYKMSTTKSDELITRCAVKYNYDYELEEFKSETEKISASELLGNNYSDEYYGNVRDEEKELFEAKYIRDEQTALSLRNFLLFNNCNQHIYLDVDLPMKYIALQVGDVVKFDNIISNTKFLGEDYTKTNVRNGQEVYPYFLISKSTKSTKGVKLKLYQLHNLNKTISTNDSPFSNLLRGDVNNDGIINVVDIVQLVNMILGTIDTSDFTSLDYFISDVTGDGYVNVVDIIQLVNTVLSAEED